MVYIRIHLGKNMNVIIDKFLVVLYASVLLHLD